MKKYAFFATTLLWILLQIACQYPVDSSVLQDLQKFLIINAELSESQGNIKVKYTLSDVDATGSYRFTADPVVENAYVVDSKGNRTDFNSNGVLDTAFRGKISETYQLHLQVDGENYTSALETMRSCPTIDSIAPIYTRESFRAVRDLNYDGLDIYAHLQDKPGEENYFQWNWVHYERALSCEKRYERSERREVLVPCIPLNCWNIFYGRDVIVQSDKLRDGQSIAKKIVRVPFVRPPVKYYLRVEQRAITPSVFSYYQSIETQTQHTGTLYDIPAQTKFSPNISNVNDPKERVMGVFNVFSSHYKIVYFDRDHPINGVEPHYLTEVIPFILDPFAYSACIESLYRTQKKPEGWED